MPANERFSESGLPVDQSSQSITNADEQPSGQVTKTNNLRELPLTTPRASSVLSAKLAQANAELEKQQQAFDAGLITEMTLLSAKSTVEVLKAELTGKLRQAAEIRLDFARRRLDLASESFESGILTAVELEKTKAEVTVAEAQLRDAGK